jgi:hypothetical protein
MNLAYIALSDKVESIPFLTDGAVEWENDPLAIDSLPDRRRGRVGKRSARGCAGR